MKSRNASRQHDFASEYPLLPGCGGNSFDVDDSLGHQIFPFGEGTFHRLTDFAFGVSQAALLVAITFWTWLWGAMGLVLATPLTVIPALVYSKQDLAEDQLDQSEVVAIWQAVQNLTEEESFRDSASVEVLPVGNAPPRLTILGCGARDKADEVALAIFQNILDSQTCLLKIIPKERLISEILEQIVAIMQRHPFCCCLRMPRSTNAILNRSNGRS